MKIKIIAAILGSVFILCSTVLIGIQSLNYESKIAKKNKEYLGIENRLITSEKTSQYANIFFNISHIQKSIAQNSIYQFENYQKNSFDAWIASLSVILLNQYEAGGYKYSEYADETIALRDKAIDGDMAAYNKMIDLTQELSVKAGKFRADLVMKKHAINQKIGELESSKRTIQFIAIVLQILGLLLLSFKEVSTKKIE